MKRATILLLGFCVLLMVSRPALGAAADPNATGPETAETASNATERGPIGAVNLFTWATGPSPDWGRGVLYALLGLVGALITVFSLIGGAIPGTAGYMRIEAGMKRVEDREKILDKLIEDPKRKPEEIEAIEAATNNLRDDIRKDRRHQFALAAGLYAVLGAFSAAMLAQDLLQSLVIGAGWTAFLGAMGLKKDYADRKSVKDQTTEKLENALSEAKGKDGQPAVEAPKLAELKREAQTSRSI